MNFTIGDITLHRIAFVAGIAIITVFHMVLGEQVPKFSTIRYPLQVSLFIALPLRVFYTLFLPFIWTIKTMTTGTLRVLGLHKKDADDDIHTEEELRMILTESEEGGAIKQSEHELIQNVFEFDDRTVKSILIPRVKISALDIDMSPDEMLSKVIEEGYIPLITLEDHFANLKPGMKQPNLYSIVEGHFDSFFNEWAKQIKQVKGIVLLRILHEFNGDWYPWCIANNDKKPELFVNAFRHIRNIFYAQDARNVKFIWCPNSMSIPQENWNFILDAYPGNEWVDFVALDIYNGAGKASTWPSCINEGSENNFFATEKNLKKGKPKPNGSNR